MNASLFDRRRPSIDERFAAFHAANPQVADRLERLVEQTLEAGAKRIGIKMLWEVLRWHVLLETRDADGFKLNNDYHARYARLLLQRRPEWRGVFETRAIKKGRAA